MATPNEHFHAKDIDTQIERSLAQTQTNDPNAQLVTDLQQFYQADAQADRQSLNYAWQHIRMGHRSQRSHNPEGKVIPMHIPSAPISGQTQNKTHSASIRRTFSLIAAAVVAALVVGSLLAVLYQARLAQNGQAGSPTPTPSPQGHPGQVVSSHKVNDDTIMGLQWSPDGKRIVLVGENAHIWDATTGKNEVTYHPNDGGAYPIQNVAWEPNGSKRVAIATKTVQIVDANTGKVLATGPKSPTANVGNLLTSVLTPLLPKSPGSAMIRAMAWSPDGKLIVSSLNDPNAMSQDPQDHPILIWNSSTGAVVKTLIGNTADAESLAWSPDGKYIASTTANWDATARVWDARTGKLMYSVPAKAYGATLSLSWSPNSQYLAVSMTVQDGNNASGEIKTKEQIQVLKASTGTPVITYPLSLPNAEPVYYLAWSHDGTRIASVENWEQTITSGPLKGQQTLINNVTIWNPMTGKALFTYQEKSGEMRGVAWSPDDTLLATANNGRSVSLKQQPNAIEVKVWKAPR
ncbi:WD40 repeat domain-containing protein [Ktedonospora formicarum]|uniref:Anaphase-promoting complex subunit 4 WD40 domain-containing protein n=1 Tax=Ktedonospora formicarum TaxID=2778364 RepID=A0A8J3I6Z0_9CHLR|nr:LpqB family beta-propeller domain-containing protein [Ktedonospora formicarum]GHO48248.1 hypothetical protein KSX_64110 [Ktedonospora formicarum]